MVGRSLDGVKRALVARSRCGRRTSASSRHEPSETWTEEVLPGPPERRDETGGRRPRTGAREHIPADTGGFLFDGAADSVVPSRVMEQNFVALLSGLVGALIGATASIATVIVQARYQARRERTRVAVEAGIEDFKAVLELSKRHSGPLQVAPLSTYIHFHAEVLEALEAGTLTPETMGEIHRRQSEMLQVLREATDDRKANH